jgi:hypothetical protein
MKYHFLQIKMDIYYESLCPDSKKFLTQVLYPIYNDFKQNMEINLIPFGKSDVSIKYQSLIFNFKKNDINLKICTELPNARGQNRISVSTWK